LTAEALAERIPADARLSLGTLRKIEIGVRPLDERTLRVLAECLGFPFEWFTVPDLGKAIEAGALEERLVAAERRLEAIEREARALFLPAVVA
jgi:hypothetical protein